MRQVKNGRRVRTGSGMDLVFLHGLDSFVERLSDAGITIRGLLLFVSKIYLTFWVECFRQQLLERQYILFYGLFHREPGERIWI